MLKQIRNRLISLVFILFGLSILTYGMTYLLPSDPIEVMIDSLGLSHDPETIERLNEEYGFDGPFWVQYTKWLKGV